MKQNPSLVISHEDFKSIMQLLPQSAGNPAHLLEEELGRAQLVPFSELPEDRVNMNSQVTFKDMDTGKESNITLVYPHEANAEKNCISILAPIGSALIGLRVGQEIEWPVPSGKKRIVKVTSVVQPDLPSKN